MPDGPRYNDDFFAWTQYQAQVLRALRTDDNRFDRENVAEAIETVGRTERDAVRSQVTRIIEHLLKLEYSPADRPRFGWMRSIAEARGGLRHQLSATLHGDVGAMLATLYDDGRRQADLGLREHGEAGAAASLPLQCGYTLDQIFAGDWYPEPPQEPR